MTVVDTLTVDTGIIWEFLKKPRISLLFRPCPTVCNCQTVKAVFLTLDVLTVDTLTLDALTLDTLTVAVLTVDALTVDALTVDTLTVDALIVDTLTLDTLTLAVLTLDIDSLFFASIKIKQAFIPHDRRRKLVIFKMKLKKFNLSYLEVLAFSEKICYNRKREKNAVLLRTVPHLIQRLLVLRKPCCRLFTVLFCYPNYNTVNSFCQGFFLFLWMLRL